MSREITLSNGAKTVVDDADFAALTPHRWWLSKGAAYCTALGYMHRFLMDAPAEKEVDHINRDPLDNRRSNLRLCTHAENMRNRDYPRASSGYRGVFAKNGRFGAGLMVGGKTLRVGAFNSVVEAAVAYDDLAKKHHGEFARLNFSPERDWILPTPSPSRQPRFSEASQ